MKRRKFLQQSAAGVGAFAILPASGSSAREEISSVAIYPPVGIARVGNSPAYFMASDLPGVAPVPKGGFKDGDGKVKKQVARFRIYGFNQAGEVVREITHEGGQQIAWRVHVANLKSAWYQFKNALDLGERAVAPERRNLSVGDRSQLVINPGKREISGIKRRGPQYTFGQGRFMGKEVALGEIRTDEKGRLLFFAADGNSASINNEPATTFANNDGWHDDVCDGTVRATVMIGGKTFEATPAVVAAAPPNFGPGLFGVVTMYDVVLDLFIREFGYPDPAANGLNFWEHIYPILERLTNTQWVNHGFFMLFGKNSPSDFTDPELMEVLADNARGGIAHSKRREVLQWFRDPSSEDYAPALVPPFYGDGIGEYQEIAIVDLAVTATQYRWLQSWADGDFDSQRPDPTGKFDQLSAAAQIAALERAPLEECLGGPFHPGIELTWPMRNARMWEAPFRLKLLAEGELPQLDFGTTLTAETAVGPGGPLDGTGPGALTRWLGVPWQTDEASCLSGYDTSTYLSLPSFWSARVPNQVLSEDAFLRMSNRKMNAAQRLKHFHYRQFWLRDFGNQYQTRINTMVQEWHEMGVVAPVMQRQDHPSLPDKVWREAGRYYSEEDPSFSQVIYAEHLGQDKPQKRVYQAGNRKRKRRKHGRHHL